MSAAAGAFRLQCYLMESVMFNIGSNIDICILCKHIGVGGTDHAINDDC